MVCIAADFAQLRPVAGGSIMKNVCDALPRVELRTVYRTRDPALLEFLAAIRKKQLAKAIVREFFRGRHLEGSLESAIRVTLSWMSAQQGRYFAWLCVTNKGADMVSSAVLRVLGITAEDSAARYPGDSKILVSYV